MALLVFLHKIIQGIAWTLTLKALSKFVKKENCMWVFGDGFKYYAGNSRALYESVVKDYPGISAVYVVNKKHRGLLSDDENFVVYGSFRHACLMLKCGVCYITHSTRDVAPCIRSDTFVVNLWHGSPLKKMGYDSRRDLLKIKKRGRYFLKPEYPRWDVITVASELFVDCFSTSLNVGKDKIFPTGLARNNYIKNKDLSEVAGLSESQITKILECKGRVFLYAPTFMETSSAKDARELLINEFSSQESFSSDVMIVKLHPKDDNLRNFLKTSSANVLNAVDVKDAHDLLPFADALITDYSSLIFDFSMRQKPIFLYCNDYWEYRDVRSGFYFDLESPMFSTMVVSDSHEEILTKLTFVSKEKCIVHHAFNVPNPVSNILKVVAQKIDMKCSKALGSDEQP